MASACPAWCYATITILTPIVCLLTAQYQTNAALSSKLRADNQGPVSAGELLRWFGIRLAMALEPK